MLDEFRGFDWDAANVAHIVRHSVTPFEVEELVRRPHLRMPAKSMNDEERWKLFGKTRSDRYLVVVFTIRRQLFRTVTAYDMNASERRKYAAQID